MKINIDRYGQKPHSNRVGIWTLEFQSPNRVFRCSHAGRWIDARRFVTDVLSGESGITEVILVRGPDSRGLGSSEAELPIIEHTGPTIYVALKVPKDIGNKIALHFNQLPVESDIPLTEDFHVTLALLGEVDKQPASRETVIKVLQDFIAGSKPLVGRLAGHGRFRGKPNSDRDPFFVLFDSADLPEFREALWDTLLEAGVELEKSHGFIPHITLAYIPKDSDMPNVPRPLEGAVRLDNLYLGWGNSEMSFNIKKATVLLEGQEFLVPEDEESIPISKRPELTERHIQADPISVEVDYDVLKELDYACPKGKLFTNDENHVILVMESSEALQFEDLQHFLYWLGETMKSGETIIAWGGPVKAMGNGKVGGQLILYGEPAVKDLTGDWFAEVTYYGPRDGDGADCMIHHGMPLRKGLEELADRLLPPIKTKRNQLGIWAETALDMADEFEKKIYELAQKGVWKWSSGTADHMIKKEANGKIMRWPIIEGSLTPTPAEPRMLNYAIQPLKAFPEMVWEHDEAIKGIFTVTSEVETEPKSPVKTVETIELPLQNKKSMVGARRLALMRKTKQVKGILSDKQIKDILRKAKVRRGKGYKPAMYALSWFRFDTTQLEKTLRRQTGGYLSQDQIDLIVRMAQEGASGKASRGRFRLAVTPRNISQAVKLIRKALHYTNRHDGAFAWTAIGEAISFMSDLRMLRGPVRDLAFISQQRIREKNWTKAQRSILKLIQQVKRL